MNEEIVKIQGMGNIKFERLKDTNKLNGNMPIKNSKYIRTISFSKLKSLINNDFVTDLLKKRNKVRIFETLPINLISQYRYDVFIKYYYVQTYIEKENYSLAKKIYLNHIKAFNNYQEPDGRKKGKEDFIKSFNRLIDNILKIGIDKTIIPITKNGEIIDGAHRLAIALYLNLKIKFAIFDLLDVDYSKDFFSKRGFLTNYEKIIEEEVVKKII